jgi:hypothetical protein
MQHHQPMAKPPPVHHMDTHSNTDATSTTGHQICTRVSIRHKAEWL